MALVDCRVSKVVKDPAAYLVYLVLPARPGPSALLAFWVLLAHPELSVPLVPLAHAGRWERQELPELQGL